MTHHPLWHCQAQTQPRLQEQKCSSLLTKDPCRAPFRDPLGPVGDEMAMLVKSDRLHQKSEVGRVRKGGGKRDWNERSAE